MSSKNPNFRFNGRPTTLQDLEVERKPRSTLIKLDLDENGRPAIEGLYHDAIKRFFQDSEVLTGLMFSAETGLQNHLRPATKEDVEAERAEKIGDMIWVVRELKSSEQMQAANKCVAVVSKMLQDLMKMQGKRPGAPTAPKEVGADPMKEIEGRYAEND